MVNFVDLPSTARSTQARCTPTVGLLAWGRASPEFKKLMWLARHDAGSAISLIFTSQNQPQKPPLRRGLSAERRHLRVTPLPRKEEPPCSGAWRTQPAVAPPVSPHGNLHHSRKDSNVGRAEEPKPTAQCSAHMAHRAGK